MRLAAFFIPQVLHLAVTLMNIVHCKTVYDT